MIDGTYQIVMKAPLGKRYGRLTLKENENKLSGDIEILGHKNQIEGNILKDGSCRFSGLFVTLTRDIKFWAEGKMDEVKVEILVHTDSYTMPIIGNIETITTNGGD